MKMKKFVSSCLVVLLALTVLFPLLPVNTGAVYTDGEEGEQLSLSEIKSVISATANYNFDSAEEMLAYELSAGYLESVSCKDNRFTIYANRYNGIVYYVNNITGQILTTNPYNPAYTSAQTGKPAVSDDLRQSLMSQIMIKFYESANSTNKQTYESWKYAGTYGQISLTKISGGFRVNYTLGDTTVRFLLPGRITAAKYEEYIFRPIMKAYSDMLDHYIGQENCPDTPFDFFENTDYEQYVYECLNDSSSNGYRKYFNDMEKVVNKARADGRITAAEAKIINNMKASLITFFGKYSLKNPKKATLTEAQLSAMYKNYPITQDGIAIYEYKTDDAVGSQRTNANLITKYCPDYTFSMMYEDEAECGYEHDATQKPVFRCALEYTFNADGSLAIRLPANSITFDETVYVLESITPLRYFNSADMSGDGYFFFPDGSGTVVEFDDFYNANKKIALNLSCSVFGQDYAYSSITGAHREQVSLPVYGAVNTTTANAYTRDTFGVSKVTNGYFAILEEGESLASVCYTSGGSQYKFGAAYASYNPLPSDKYDLSQTISVGSLGEYTIVADSKYSGSYVSRIVMLTDPTVGAAAYGAGNYYESSYVGMATYYRDYLKANGVLTALTTVNEDLPLYIESLGSMQITTKILSFPITVDIALTSFGDIATMYDELSACKTFTQNKANEYNALADAEQDETLKATYRARAQEYQKLSDSVDNIGNINFKLTGFANGGMYYTYPAKLKFERVLGGNDGFRWLIDKVNAVNAEGNSHFGVFPEFDFMYISNQKIFDGITVKNNVSCMVDNRYASKQTYDSVTQEYVSNFTLVISPSSLDGLYSKFSGKYSQYDIRTISASTLGSDLNSNFDEDNPINRVDAQTAVEALLNRMAVTDGYEMMMNIGNVYTLKYASHLLDASIDSSHFRYSSYAVPFVGMILHGYKNYAGSAINYAGSPNYNILRSIESGASLYYILCYQNTANLKDDLTLNKYYGVDYANWYANLITVYTELNRAIGSLQTYEIVNHRVLLSERVIDMSEQNENYVRLEDELLEMVSAQIALKIDAAFDTLREQGETTLRVKLVVDREALVARICRILGLTEKDLTDDGFLARLDAILDANKAEYPGQEGHDYEVTFDSVEYKSKYSYLTDSSAFDSDYVFTDYTVDNGNVVMVTYSNGTDTVHFLLNYNVYSVNVKLDDTHSFTLQKYSYIKLDSNLNVLMKGGEN